MSSPRIAWGSSSCWPILSAWAPVNVSYELACLNLSMQKNMVMHKVCPLCRILSEIICAHFMSVFPIIGAIQCQSELYCGYMNYYRYYNRIPDFLCSRLRPSVIVATSIPLCFTAICTCLCTLQINTYLAQCTVTLISQQPLLQLTNGLLYFDCIISEQHLIP